MGTVATLPTRAAIQSDGPSAEESLQNAATGYLRALETACRARTLKRYPPAKNWREEELTFAIVQEAKGELMQLHANLKKMLQSRHPTK